MGQRTNILLQIEARNGSHLNQVYHLQWGCRKYMPMAFLHILSSRYFKPLTTDIFEHFAKAIHLDGIEVVDKDWRKYDFNKLEDCTEVLDHCDNNNGAMVVIISEGAKDCLYPTYKVGFLLGPENLEDESPFCRWVATNEFMQHQPRYKKEYDDIFAHAFDALTALSGTQHLVGKY
ncbi:hypothetical protein [Sharpea azabuensis]|jgi:hypothetical protein|uniref:hypothetical protein n=1 Tax=Sharpea azabuensis TaxID=322505 RepID=UPI0013DA9C0B|nr:hypothetical protein [Sharpea azabuensis]